MEALRIRQQRLDLETAHALDLRREMSQHLLWDWGGSERFMFLTYDDIDNERISDKRRTQRANNFYLWGSLNLDDIHSFYVRFHGQQIDWNSGDEYRSTENQFKWNMEEGFDQGTYTIHIDRALKKYFDYEIPAQIQLTAGRFRSSIGSQLAYVKRANGVQLDVMSKWVDLKLFGFKNLIDEENIDFSVPGFRSSRRYFFGVEAKYKGFRRHVPYLFALIQEDHNRENIEDPDQDYGYDSKYYGIGSRGQIMNNLFYEIEGIMQRGKGFPQAAVARGYSPDNERIEAWALDASLHYTYNKITHPTFSAEYAFGSGDKDRIGRVTNTTGGGNKEGTTDRNFLTFGYIDTGLTLAARISNLRMVKLGFSFTPLEVVKSKSVNVEVNYFLFRKDEKKSAISDTRADRPIRNLGKEFDVNITWQIFSDLSASINYGRFYPGNAYSDKDARDFVMATIMFQF
ncbi:MAG: alginate export family protein [Candidatus Scalindua sp.]|jgi:hypothetical protein|nr:alginate export family protein [Candidatus Scalindua sp.]MBT5307050.1 alginate export family protein [Candidatus Scalindua sp.]MBT6564547.1 alginate export family protein [Candidatus Scalindua sp.]MBT7211559.1 alginate export family protein [Candidatus Scalindua sp.]MBT7590122.1 alginate export family protein [Candidatus Scalindua sp.]